MFLVRLNNNEFFFRPPAIGDVIERQVPRSDFIIGIITDSSEHSLTGPDGDRNIFSILALDNNGNIMKYKFWEYTIKNYYMLSKSNDNIELVKKKYLEYQLCEIIEK